MTRQGKIILSGATTFLVFLVGALFTLGPWGLGFSWRTQILYNRIPLGMNQQEVIRLLGQPRKVDKQFCLPQRKGFEKYFKEAERSGATEFYLWINGVNWYYCIGFDSAGKVAVKGEGCS